MEDQQIMSIALLKVKYLDSINVFQVSQLLRLFNLQQNGQHLQQKILQLKKTISFILLIERNHFHDYLNLPKFRALDNIFMTKLVTYISNLWDNFIKQKEAIGNSSLKDITATKTPLDRLTHYIASQNIVPNKNQLSHPNFQRNFCFYPPIPNQADPMNFTLDPYFMQYRNFQGSSIFNDNTSKNKNLPNTKQDNQTLPNMNMSHPKIPQQINKYQTIFKQEEISSHSFSQQVENKNYGQFDPNPIFKCICQQNYSKQINQVPQYFRQKAQQYLKLLRDHKSDNRPCPLCTICKNHFFTKLAVLPIMFGWQSVDQQILTIKKIYLLEEEAKLYDKSLYLIESSSNYNIELRVLRIGLKQARNNKGFKTSFTIPINELKKLSTRKWLQIKLKGNTQRSLVFFALLCICNKSLQQIKKQLSEQININDNFISSWIQKKNLPEIQINMIHPITKKIIQFPVRGQLCDHLECEDLNYIYYQFIENKKQNKIQCSICQKVYTVYQKFKVDGWLLQRLVQRNHQIYKFRQFSLLKYKKNGDIQWLTNNRAMQSQSNNQMVQESQIIDSEDSSIQQSAQIPKNSFSC